VRSPRRRDGGVSLEHLRVRRLRSIRRTATRSGRGVRP